MKTLLSTFGCLLSLVVFSSVSQAEDFKDLMQRAQQFEDEGKFPQALTELNLAVQEIQRRHVEKLKEFAPGDVSGMTAEPAKAQAAMGMVSVEKVFKGSGGERIRFAITGGSAGAAGGMGAMMGLAQMAHAMGGVNSETVRVGGKRGQLTNQNGRLSFSMGVGSGAMMLIEQQGGKSPSKEQILAIANATNIEGLDKYLEQN